MKRLSARLLVLTTVLVLLREVAFPAGPGSGIEVPADGASVPMLDIGGRPVVEVKLNGRGPFPFILDTGATHTVVDSSLSKEDASLSGEDGRMTELSIGAVKLTGIAPHIGPVSAMFGKIDHPPLGVLSALSFPGYLVVFDYPARKISFRKGALAEANGKTIFGYAAEEALPIVPVKVASQEINVHLDTGAPLALAVPTRYKDQVPLTGPAIEKGKARTHAGEYPIFQGTVDGDIEIGEFKLASRDIHFTDIVPSPGAIPQGQVGYAALREFVVTLDSANRRIKFAKP